MTIGRTNAIIGSNKSGGGETVLAHNASGKSLTQDEKVLLRYNISNTKKKTEYTTNAATNYKYKTYLQPIWFDENTFSIFGENTTLSYKYSYNGSQWSRGQLSSWANLYTGSISNFYYTDKGIMYTENKYDNNGKNVKRVITNSDGTYTNISSGLTSQTLQNYGATIDGNIIWSGETEGYSTFSIYLGTTAFTRGDNYWLVYVDKDNSKLLYQAGYGSSSYYHIVEFSGITVISDTASSFGGANFLIGCTGLSEGDYVILCPANSNSWNNYKSEHGLSSPAGISPISFIVYKINNNKFVPIDSIDSLSAYTSLEKSIWHFDNRNNCLTIGTTDAVYVLEFIPSTKTWKMLITISSPLPNNNSDQYIYNATLSPDKTKLAVYAGDSQYLSQNLFIYDITSGYKWTIVENSAQNYDSVLSFSGIYANGGAIDYDTGESYEIIKVTLPPKTNIVCTLDMGETNYVPEVSIV